MHTGLTSRRPDWRTWIAIAAIALVGATSTAAVWHTPHDADQDCAVCQLRRHQSSADLSTYAGLRCGDVTEPLTEAPRLPRFSSEHHGRIPARAPPC